MFTILLETRAIRTLQACPKEQCGNESLDLGVCLCSQGAVMHGTGACAHTCTGLCSFVDQLVLPWQLGMPCYLLN